MTTQDVKRDARVAIAWANCVDCVWAPTTQRRRLDSKNRFGETTKGGRTAEGNEARSIHRTPRCAASVATRYGRPDLGQRTHAREKNG
jgi:hypothetical protein